MEAGGGPPGRPGTGPLSQRSGGRKRAPPRFWRSCRFSALQHEAPAADRGALLRCAVPLFLAGFRGDAEAGKTRAERRANILCRYKNVWNIHLQLRPSLIAGIMKDSGNKPPALLPRKAQYLTSDVKLLGQHMQVPLRFPKDFFSVILEKGSLLAMRFLTAVDMEHPEMLEKASRELWMRVWSRDEDIVDPQSILAAAEKAGMSTQQARGLLEKTSTPQVKNQLKETTEAACKYGAFGLPVTVAHLDGQTHMLFGSDRMELLAHLLGEKWMGPVPPAMSAKL